MDGARVLVLKGEFAGEQGVCLGAADHGRFTISPDCTDAILTLEFETEFGLLVDLSCDPSKN
jgi:hypothetical protein